MLLNITSEGVLLRITLQAVLQRAMEGAVVYVVVWMLTALQRLMWERFGS